MQNGYRVEFVDNEKHFFDYIKLKAQGKELRFKEAIIGESSSSALGPYDAIILSEAIEHMAEPETALRFLNQCLKTGGLLVLSTPNGDYIDCYEPSWEEVKNQKDRNRGLANSPSNHVCEFTMGELAKLVKSSGFGLLSHYLVNSKNISRHPMLRLLPESILWEIDGHWSKKKSKGKSLGRTQIIVAQKF